MSDGPLHSTGRGGAGNIGKDDTVYADGGIVREGYAGEASDDKQYSSGRGGAGNVSTPKMHPADGRRGSQDIIPETALRADEHDSYHTGRGGEGNVHKDKLEGEPKKEGIVDKVKHALHLDKKHEATPAAKE